MATITDRRRHNFFVVDNAVLDLGLSPHAITIYNWLARFSDPNGRSFPAIPTLAERARMSKPTVRKALDELVAAGLVEITQRAWKANDYQLLPMKESTSLTPNPENPREESTSLTGESTSLTGGVNVVDPNKTQLPIPKEQDWQEVKKTLKAQLTHDTYELYIHPSRATLDHANQIVTIHAPNRYVYDWLTVRLHRVIRREIEHRWPDYDLHFAEPA